MFNATPRHQLKKGRQQPQPPATTTATALIFTNDLAPNPVRVPTLQQTQARCDAGKEEDPTNVIMILGLIIVGLVCLAVGSTKFAKRKAVRTHDENGEEIKKVTSACLMYRCRVK